MYDFPLKIQRLIILPKEKNDFSSKIVQRTICLQTYNQTFLHKYRDQFSFRNKKGDFFFKIAKNNISCRITPDTHSLWTQNHSSKNLHWLPNILRKESTCPRSVSWVFGGISFGIFTISALVPVTILISSMVVTSTRSTFCSNSSRSYDQKEAETFYPKLMTHISIWVCL